MLASGGSSAPAAALQSAGRTTPRRRGTRETMLSDGEVSHGRNQGAFHARRSYTQSGEINQPTVAIGCAEMYVKLPLE
jgi:hypothetical protein